jgi:uracil DNA glycosylase
MLRALHGHPIGKQWYILFDKDLRVKLHAIDIKLASLWEQRLCFPSRGECMLPFMLIPPHNVKLVLICKEPYNSDNMCTGIPVEVKGNILDTMSAKIFREIIGTCYGNDGSVTNTNYMQKYYDIGVLVINAAFTTVRKNTRQDMNLSHFPLWCTFVKPFIEKVNASGVHILALGSEGSKVVRNMIPVGDNIHTCPFPKDRKTADMFRHSIINIMNKYVLDDDTSNTKDIVDDDTNDIVDDDINDIVDDDINDIVDDDTNDNIT